MASVTGPLPSVPSMSTIPIAAIKYIFFQMKIPWALYYLFSPGRSPFMGTTYFPWLDPAASLQVVPVSAETKSSRVYSANSDSFGNSLKLRKLFTTVVTYVT